VGPALVSVGGAPTAAVVVVLVMMSPSQARRPAFLIRQTTLDSGRCRTNRLRQQNRRTPGIVPLAIEWSVGEGAADGVEVVVVVVQAGREVLGRSILVVAESPSEEMVKVRRQGMIQPVLLGCRDEPSCWSWCVQVLHGIAVVRVQAEEWWILRSVPDEDGILSAEGIVVLDAETVQETSALER